MQECLDAFKYALMTDDEEAIRRWWDHAKERRDLFDAQLNYTGTDCGSGSPILPDPMFWILIEILTLIKHINRLITSMLWHIQIEPAPGQMDRLGERLALEAERVGAGDGPWSIRASRGFLIEGEIAEAELERAARDVLVDPVVESPHDSTRAGRAGKSPARSSTSCPSPA